MNPPRGPAQFASHLREDLDVIDGFRTRHGDRDDLDDHALGDMASPQACLSPAVCYHIYHLHQDRTIPATGTAHGVCGSCFRYESIDTSDLRRLWDFTMREIVFMGTREDVLQRRAVAIQQVAVTQAEQFTKAVKCSGIILSKLDGTAKGGAVFAIKQKVGLPVKFIGVGEGLDDLEPFDPDAFVAALFENGRKTLAQGEANTLTTATIVLCLAVAVAGVIIWKKRK